MLVSEGINAKRFLQRFESLLVHDDIAVASLCPRLWKQSQRQPSFPVYYRLLASCAEQLTGSDFFLRLGNQYDITDLGILGYAMLSAENLEKSWQLSMHSSSLLHHPLQTEKLIEQDQLAVKLITPIHDDTIAQALSEEWLFGTWRWICQRLPKIAGDSSVEMGLGFEAPDYVARYREFFPGRIKFNQEHSYLKFNLSWYQKPFDSANPQAAQLCRQQCDILSAQRRHSGLQQSEIIETIKDRLLVNPSREFPSLKDMAASLHIAPHTLARRLKAVGSGYREIVLQVRMELAHHYIVDTRLPFQEICYLLDYQHPPSFYRVFKKHTGMTPDELRCSSAKSEK